MLNRLLGRKEAMPSGYSVDDPTQRRISSEFERRREIIKRNDENIARYLRHPEAQARFRRELAIRAALAR